MQSETVHLSCLAENTSRYARYSRSAGGLSLVIGGVLCLAAFVIGAAVELTPAWRYTLVAAPLLWLASKELLRAFYYQRAGAVRERLSDRQRRGHFWMVAYLAAMALLVLVGLSWSAGARTCQWPGIAYVATVADLPLFAARRCWSTADLLVGVPLLWLASKELLRAFYYQRAGAVRERLSDRQRRGHFWMVAYLAAMALLIIGGLAWSAGARTWQWPGIAYVAIVAAMPLVAARWFWSTGDFLVGVLLICQAAVVIVGLNYPWYWILIAGLYAAIAIPTGWREHRRSEEHTSELQSLMRISYAVFCLNKKNKRIQR